ncbi:MAG: pilus assembly protein TadG-related protein [Solirubrobacterales bacterium]
MRCLFEERGAVTMYTAIIMMSVILFFGLLIDLGRIRLAQNQSRRAMNAAARSMLADYHTDLRNRYGLYGMNSAAQADRSRAFQNYLQWNLQSGRNQNFILLDCQVESASVQGIYPLDDPETLRQQILEEMKYRAPVDLGRNLFEKLAGMKDLLTCFSRNRHRAQDLQSLDSTLRQRSEREINVKSGVDKYLAENRAKKVLEAKLAERERRLDELAEIICHGSYTAARKAEEESKYVQQECEQLRSEIGRIKVRMHRIRTEIQKQGREALELEQDIRDSSAELDEIKELTASASKMTDPAAIEKEILAADRAAVGRLEEAQTAAENVSASNNAILKRMTATGSENQFINDCERFEPASYNGLPGNEGNQGESVARTLRAKYEQKAFDARNPELVSDLSAGFMTPEEAMAELGAAEDKLFMLVNPGAMMISMRDELYLNEFIVGKRDQTQRFENLASSELKAADAETILFGSSREALVRIWAIRFALDCPAYYIFVFKALGPLYGGLASAGASVFQAGIDVLELLDGETIGLTEVIPDERNLLNRNVIGVDYSDCLRMAALVWDRDDGKMERMTTCIKERSGADVSQLSTAVDGTAVVSVKMWFLPLAGCRDLAWGPFGTRFLRGRCYLDERVYSVY